jgi:predicted nucleic acid-binding protein
VVRVFLREPGSEQARAILEDPEGVVASVLVPVEFRSAVARRRRAGALGAAEEALLVAAFEAEWTGSETVPISADLLADAGALVQRRALRTLDAIHLASALWASRGGPGPIRFGSADARLNAAARAEGLEVTA